MDFHAFPFHAYMCRRLLHVLENLELATVSQLACIHVRILIATGHSSSTGACNYKSRCTTCYDLDFKNSNDVRSQTPNNPTATVFGCCHASCGNSSRCNMDPVLGQPADKAQNQALSNREKHVARMPDLVLELPHCFYHRAQKYWGLNLD